MFTVGGSSGSGGALSAPAEGVGAAGSVRFSALPWVAVEGDLTSGAAFVEGAEVGAGPDSGGRVNSGVATSAGVFLLLSFLDLAVAAVDLGVVGGFDADVDLGVTAGVFPVLDLPLAESWAKPVGAGGATATGFTAGAGVSELKPGRDIFLSPMLLANLMTPRAIA